MDDADRAKDIEMLEREHALARQRERAAHDDDGTQLFIDGVVCCVDCGEPVAPGRLAVRPHARRCLPCKQILEVRAECNR